MKSTATQNPLTRRDFLKHSLAAASGAALYAALPTGIRTGAWAAGSDAPEKTELKVGFIPLTDCASVVMASVKEFDKKYGIKIIPSKEASWAAVRDKLVNGELDAAHVLYGLVYGVQLGIGGTQAETTQGIWKDHPEKVLGTTADFVKNNPNAARALTMAVLEASRYIDVMENRPEVARVIADKSFVNTAVDVIEGRMMGRYENGLGKTWQDPNYMKFYNDGAASFPYLSDGMWFSTQHKRWGLLKEHPDDLAVAKKINQIELYKEAAGQLKINIPSSDMRSSTLFDGKVWDGSDPKAYADGFKIKA